MYESAPKPRHIGINAFFFTSQSILGITGTLNYSVPLSGTHVLPLLKTIESTALSRFCSQSWNNQCDFCNLQQNKMSYFYVICCQMLSMSLLDRQQRVF